LDFYAQRIVPSFDMKNVSNYMDGTYVVTDAKGKTEILECSENFQVIDSLPDYSVTRLRNEFMFQNTRHKALRTNYLLYKTE
jgi:hypothetical protein